MQTVKLFRVVLVIVLCAGCLPAFCQQQLTLYFANGESAVTEVHKKQIDSFIYAERLPISSAMQILGYADTVGRATANLQLSKRRALNVRHYLATSGIDSSNIATAVGYGEDSKMDSRERNRRVDIIFNSSASQKRQNFDAQKLKAGDHVILDILFFEGNDTVRPASYPTLSSLYEFLAANKNATIRLEGHACCSYQAEKKIALTDKQLSIDRAKAVYNYLVERGIDKLRLSYMGWGGEKPLIHPEKNEADENRNRRVEVKIIKM